MKEKDHHFFIIMMGPPGSGKGTQSQKLSEKLNLPHVSSGDLLRLAIINQTHLGKKSKTYIDEGNLVPDLLVWELMHEQLIQPEYTSGCILDGFPRTLEQARYLEQFFDAIHCDYQVIVLDVSDEEIIRRIHLRYICPICKYVYNKEQGFLSCPRCNDSLIQRTDDNLETIQRRLIDYKLTTEPVVRYYDQLNKVIRISANHSQELILDQILKILKTQVSQETLNQ